MFILSVVLWSILHFSFSQDVPTTPCPGVVKYEHIGTQWVAKITAENPPPYGSLMKIKLKMSIPERLPSQYVGKIEPTDSSSAVVEKILKHLPIQYTVYFPLLYPLPNFVSIDFDGRIICSGPPATGSYVTTIDLEYTFKTGSGTVTEKPIPVRPAPPISYPDPIRTPQYPAYASPPRQSPTGDISANGNDICGTTLHNVALINGGDETDRGEFPWLVAFYRFRNEPFFCAGSLISNKHVLTASHCMVQSNGKTINANDFLVKLGVHNLNIENEKKSEVRFPLRIITRPDYDSTVQFNDIAIVIMNSVVSFNEYIRPVCLWTGSDDQSLIVGKKGTVVGWGLDEYQKLLKDGPRKVTPPIVSTEECKASNPHFHSTTSANTLCAGSRDGIGPCKGDSGGGLYVVKDRKWVIRGIVSNSIGDPEKICNLYEYVVYTDVAKYISWIRESF